MINKDIIAERRQNWHTSKDVAEIHDYLHSILAANPDMAESDAAAKAGDILSTASQEAEDYEPDWARIALNSYYKSTDQDDTDEENALTDLLSHFMKEEGSDLRGVMAEMASVAEVLHGVARDIA